MTTTAGTIRADAVVLATEAYTSQLPGRRRDVLPIYSMMIGSEPLNDAQWAAIGLADRQTFTVATHVVVYGQRTADGRMAFGGRGAPYHFGSRVDDRFDTDERRSVGAAAARSPSCSRRSRDVDFPFHWGGRLAAPRDWHPHVTYDRVTGVASAGGYVGDGVATANLAGRTLADLILERRYRPDPPAVGRASLPTVGTRAAALARCAASSPQPRARADHAESAGSGPYSEAAGGGVDQARRHVHRSLSEARVSSAAQRGVVDRRPGGGSCGPSPRRARHRDRAAARTASWTGPARECRGRTGRRPSG